MGLNTWIRDRFRSVLVPFGGIVSTPTDDDEFSVAIGNEVLGGHHGYQTLEELADVPKARMLRPMLATVLTHQRPDGSSFKRITYTLDPSDEIWGPFLNDATLSKISDIPGYDLSLFWRPFDLTASQNPNNVIESQYAAEQDYGRPGDPASPAFQPPLITAENYQLGQRSDADPTIIWFDTYDPTIHKYERQRLNDNGNWGIPKLINATTYSQGDYIDNRFIWVDLGEVPTRPPSILNGLLNNDPPGWSNDPAVPGGGDYYDYIQTHDLYQITGSKDAFQNLKSEWSTPVKISTDPELVRYGNNPSSTEFLGPGNSDTPDWRGYFTPNLDTHMATRLNVSSPWRIKNISSESGEYVDHIYKAFPIGYEPSEPDRPTLSDPFSDQPADEPNAFWKDYPFVVGVDEVLHQSVGRKYNNGQIKPSGWSIPTRADGKDTIQAVIEPQTETVFKRATDNTVSPATIVLNAVQYRGNSPVDPDMNFRWYKGPVDDDNEIIKDSIIGPSANHVISGPFNNVLTVSPDAVDGNQLYTLVGIYGGEDYVDTESIQDVTDGAGIIVVIKASDGFVFKNTAGSKTFIAQLYYNGTLVPDTDWIAEWLLGSTDITPVPDTSVDIDAADFTDEETLHLNITYQGTVYSRSESLVDVTDAEEAIYQYSTQHPLPVDPDDIVWTTDPTGAWFARVSTDGGVTYGAPYQIRGENAPYNGGFQKSAYKNSVGQPSATGLTTNLLPTGAGWTAQPTTPGPSESVWETTSFFVKNPATSDTSQNDSNWIQDGTWSSAIKKTGTDGSASGPPGDTGAQGWSPVFALITRDANSEVMQIVDWTNDDPAANPSFKPITGRYIGPSGLVSNIASAKNVKGNPGSDANSRPQYYVSVGLRRIGIPTTVFNNPGALVYKSSTLQVTNTWTSTRYFNINGQIPVREDSGVESWNVRMCIKSTNSFGSTPGLDGATFVDATTSRQDFIQANPANAHNIKVNTVLAVAPGGSVYVKLAFAQTNGGASYAEDGFIEAFGI